MCVIKDVKTPEILVSKSNEVTFLTKTVVNNLTKKNEATFCIGSNPKTKEMTTQTPFFVKSMQKIARGSVYSQSFRQQAQKLKNKPRFIV